MPHWWVVAEEALAAAGLLVAGVALLPEELAAAALAAAAEGLITLEASAAAAMTGATGAAIEMVGLGETVAAVGALAGEGAAVVDGIGLAGAVGQMAGAAAGVDMTAVSAGLIGTGLGVGALAAGGAIHNGLAGAPGNQTPTSTPTQQATPAQTTPTLPPPGTQGPAAPSAPKRSADEAPYGEPGAKRTNVHDPMDIDHHMYMVAPGVYYDEDHEMFYDEDDDMYFDISGNRAKRPGDSNFFDAKPSRKRKQGASFRPAATDTVSVSVLALLAAVTALLSAVTAKLAHSHCHVELDDGESNVIQHSPPKDEE